MHRRHVAFVFAALFSVSDQAFRAQTLALTRRDFGDRRAEQLDTEYERGRFGRATRECSEKRLAWLAGSGTVTTEKNLRAAWRPTYDVIVPECWVPAWLHICNRHGGEVPWVKDLVHLVGLVRFLALTLIDN